MLANRCLDMQRSLACTSVRMLRVHHYVFIGLCVINHFVINYVHNVRIISVNNRMLVDLEQQALSVSHTV